MRRTVGAISAVAVVVLAAAAARAATLSPDYLVGRWTTGGADACASPGAEISELRADGSFTTLRDGKAVAVGFWRLVDDRLDLEVLAHDSLNEALLGVPGDYGYFTVASLLFDVGDDGYRTVQSIGTVLQGLNVVRCR
jgi:hypothetical protein